MGEKNNNTGKMIVMNIGGRDVICEFKVTKEEKESLINSANNKALIRYLIDQYEQSQSYRIRGDNQLRSFLQGYDKTTGDGILHEAFITKQRNLAIAQEAMNKRYMDIITNEIPFCKWAKSICGIGPVLSAYLYATFDIGNGRYATDFMSYAGLNDNRNPWLGEAKGKALAKEVQERVIREVNETVRPILELYDSTVKDSGRKKLNAQLKKIDLTANDLDLLYEVRSILDTLTNGKGDIFVPVLSNLFEKDATRSLEEYVELIKSPSACTDTMMMYAAQRTGRKFSNVKKGTQQTNASKKSAKQLLTIGDLASYLAKPPYNRDCKKRMHQIGDSFKMQCKRPKSLYGRLYTERKLHEVRKNEHGDFADQAAKLLSEKDYNTNTDTYQYLIKGQLSPAHLDARASRWAQKLFLSHVHEAMWWEKYHKDVPQYYTVAYLNHHDYIAPEVDYKLFIP